MKLKSSAMNNSKNHVMPITAYQDYGKENYQAISIEEKIYHTILDRPHELLDQLSDHDYDDIAMTFGKGLYKEPLHIIEGLLEEGVALVEMPIMWLTSAYFYLKHKQLLHRSTKDMHEAEKAKKMAKKTFMEPVILMVDGLTKIVYGVDVLLVAPVASIGFGIAEMAKDKNYHSEFETNILDAMIKVGYREQHANAKVKEVRKFMRDMMHMEPNFPKMLPHLMTCQAVKIALTRILEGVVEESALKRRKTKPTPQVSALYTMLLEICQKERERQDKD